MKLVTVSSAFNPASAQLVRSRLEAAGFHPVVAHELSALSLDGYAMAAGGILVQVPENEAEEVRAFLSDEGESEASEDQP
jgi:hydrogenase maturation factor